VRRKLYLPPPQFATSQPPQSLDFSNGKVNLGSDALGSTAGVVNTETVVEVMSVDLDTSNAAPPKEVSTPTTGIPASLQILMTKVRTAMNRKPVWTRETLAVKVDSSVSKLARASWRFVYQSSKGGAYAGSVFLRRGFDPRQNRDFSQYQPMRFRISKETVARMLVQVKRLNLRNLEWLGSRPKTYPTILIGDVPDEEFRDIARTHVASQYKPRAGWYSEETRQLLLKRLDQIVEELVDTLEKASPNDDQASLFQGSFLPLPANATWAESPLPEAEHRESSSRNKDTSLSFVESNAGFQTNQDASMNWNQGAPPPPSVDVIQSRYNVGQRGSIDETSTFAQHRPPVPMLGSNLGHFNIGNPSSSFSPSLDDKSAKHASTGSPEAKKHAALAYDVMGDEMDHAGDQRESLSSDDEDSDY